MKRKRRRSGRAAVGSEENIEHKCNLVCIVPKTSTAYEITSCR